LIFFDETGIDSNIQNDYALSEKGKRAYGKKSNGRRNRTNLLEGLGVDGLKAPFRFQGNINGDILVKYFADFFVPELKPGDIVVMDNASFHKRKEIKKAIEEAGCFLLKLPSYSPDLNPIEQFWLKRLIKEAKKKLDSHMQAIDQSLQQPSTLDPSGYFEHFFKTVTGLF
jgi:putative transposase